MFDIAIVGLGATGVSLLSHIQDEVYNLHPLKPRIVVCNPGSSFAMGKAFGDADPVHKVNTPPGMMAMTGTEPNKFGQWLENIFDSQERWPARLKYSGFISEAYDEIKQAGVCDVTEHRKNIVNVSVAADGFVIKDEDGFALRAGKVILCLGAQSSNLFPNFRNVPGFVSHFSEFPGGEDDLIIAGSGLTAIDAFRYAYAKGTGRINIYSRSGYAPTCLSSSNRYIPKYLNWRNIIAASATGTMLQAFTRLLRKEFVFLGTKSEFHAASRLLGRGQQEDYFGYLLSRAEAGDLPWQDVLVSTRPYMHKLWRALTISERQFFSQHYGALWAAWRHPIPQEVFAELKEASSIGRVEFHQQSCSPVYQNDAFVLTTTKKEVVAKRFWDATGGGSNINGMESELLTNLLRQELIEGHPCGGVNVDADTFQCKVRGKNIKNLYSVGPLNKGCLFSTNAFWFNARCAELWSRQWAIECRMNSAKDLT